MIWHNSILYHIWPDMIQCSVLWRCWLGGRKSIRPVKNWVEGCWCGYLSGARCRLAYDQLPLPLTVSRFSEIQIGFTFLVPAHLGSPGQRPLNGCVCIRACDTAVNTGILLPERWCKDCTFFVSIRTLNKSTCSYTGFPSLMSPVLS